MYRAMKAARSLLVISNVRPDNTKRYNKFRMKLVNRTERVPPFKFPDIYDMKSVR